MKLFPKKFLLGELKLLEIDGHNAGGQLLRTALALSLLSNQPFEMKNIRAARPRPGLMRQHLTCVQAAQEISSAKVEGAKLLSQYLSFEPHELAHGSYRFDVGTAGSITLVYQSLAPALAFAKDKTILEITGGTDTHLAPLASYIIQVFLPTIACMGFNGSAAVVRHGFYPEGGGAMRFETIPVKQLHSINLSERGELMKIVGESAAANLPKEIAERQEESALKKLVEHGIEAGIEVKQVQAVGKGTYLFLLSQFQNSLAGFSSLGAVGKPAEKVGEEAASELISFLSSSACVEKHLADQLLLYAALANGESIINTQEIDAHVETNVEVVKQFLPKAEITVEEKTIRVKGVGLENKHLTQ